MMALVLWLLTGVDREKWARQCPASRRRTSAYALAILLPVSMWWLCSWSAASAVFHLDTLTCALVATFCAAIAFTLERLIQLAPDRWFVALARVVTGIGLAIGGSAALDLSVYRLEIQETVAATALAEAKQVHAGALQGQQTVMKAAQDAWMKADDKALCEAENGCKSVRGPGTGRVYEAKKQSAGVLRGDYERERDTYARMKAEGEQALGAMTTASAMQDAGPLKRLEALHQFLDAHPWAKAGWAVIAILIACLELSTLLVKAAFGRTLTDEIEEMKRRVNQARAQSYMATVVTSHQRLL